MRDRLARRGFAADAIDGAIEALLADRSIDDARTAAAAARTELTVRGRGPRRILSRLAALGIDQDVARTTVRELVEPEGEDALLEAALARRLRDPARLTDPAERRRLLARLVRQGFSPSAASALIRKLARRK